VEEDKRGGVPTAVRRVGGKKGVGMRKFGVSAVMTVLTLLVMVGLAFAQEEAGADAGNGGLIALGAGLGLGLAGAGAGVGQGFAVASALESIGRNPNAADRIFTPMIIGLAFMEALAIYALVIAFIFSGKF
jgi:F-type H+-transporting ATPase subunit c